MSKLNSLNNNKESGFENFDDCAIFQIDKEQSIIQTVDFFTPIVDDPYTFGQIAAANSLSDIYAMGGMPLFALNIVAFPTETLNLDILSSILKGGKDTCESANINILGGHSIKDDSPKYGLAVTGIIKNKNILRNNGSKVGDDIILTKPLGTGIITTAIKKNIASITNINDAVNVMTKLNNILSNIEKKSIINACTDVTGYGLLGHLNEMCKASNKSAMLNFMSIPFLDQVKTFAMDGIIPGGSKKNLEYYKNEIDFDGNIETYQKLMLADAQTSGGLLLSVPKNESKKLVNILNMNSDFNSCIIGEFINKDKKSIIVKNG